MKEIEERLAKELTQKQRDVLADIQKQALKKFKKQLFVKQDNKEILFVFDRMLERDLEDWERKYYVAMRKDFVEEKSTIDEDVAKQMDEYVVERIKKAIKEGELPQPK